MDLLDLVSGYWPVIGGIVTFIVGYTVLRNQNANQEKRLSKIEGKVESLEPIFLQIQKDLVGIQTTLKFVEQKIDRMENHFKISTP